MSARALYSMPSDVDYTRCRALGHAWDDIEAERAPAYGYLMLFRCDRCTTMRRDLVDRYGVLIPGGRSYKYPDGYRDAEHVERSEYRRRLLTTMPGYVPRKSRKRRAS